MLYPSSFLFVFCSSILLFYLILCLSSTMPISILLLRTSYRHLHLPRSSRGHQRYFIRSIRFGNLCWGRGACRLFGILSGCWEWILGNICLGVWGSWRRAQVYLFLAEGVIFEELWDSHLFFWVARDAWVERWSISPMHCFWFWDSYEECACICSSTLSTLLLHTFYLRFTGPIFYVKQFSRDYLVRARNVRDSCRKFYWQCLSCPFRFCFYCLQFYFRWVWS